AERFTRMTNEERRAIDATLRIIRRSQVELLFKANIGKQLTSGGREFQKYFAIIKSEASGMRELRYENLIVEKAIFNKLILKSTDQDNFIWVPSFYVEENVDALIEKNGVQSEHFLLTKLRELAAEGKLESLKPFLGQVVENLGVVAKTQKVPSEISDFFHPVEEYNIMPPIDLDDITSFLDEEKARQVRVGLDREEKTRLETEAIRQEQERKSEQLRQRLRPGNLQVLVPESQKRGRTENSICLGKQLEFGQFVSAINRRIQGKDLPAQVKQTADYYIELTDLRDTAIVGSAGSGKSNTLRRIVDGIADKATNGPKLIVLDPKGEHRGIAWKHKWRVWAFVKDTQATEFKVSILSADSRGEDSPDLLADLIQEWFSQSGLACTDQQKERIASVIRGQALEGTNLSSVAELLAREPELSQLAQKLKKNLVLKSSFSRIFSDSGLSADSLRGESMLFDVSGRGLKDPTSKEERQMISVLLLRDMVSAEIRDSIIVIEDVLDKFKNESLKLRATRMIQVLRANGNTIIATSRSQLREFLGKDRIEFVHRLSGEKVVVEELSGFNSDVSTQILMRIIGFFPRGYLISSKISEPDGLNIPTAVVHVDQLQFVSSQV
ncbi:MAG: helicase HerA domain-containing protein, partial [Nitrososphaerales archaeon]